MAGLTGILGTSASQPGSFQLGAGPPAAGGIPVEHDIAVDHSISFSIDMTLFQRFGPTITVAQTITPHIERAVSVNHSITVSQDITGGPQTETRLTQDIVEVLYIGIPQLYLTQQIVEVLYRPAPAFTITDSIDVSQTIQARSDTIHQTVSQTVAPVQSMGVATSNVGTIIIQSVNVTDNIIVKGDRNITVSQNVNVTPTIQARNTNVRITVTDEITPGQSETPVYFPPQSVSQSATISQQLGWSPHSITVNQGIVVVPSIYIRDQTIPIQQNVYVTDSIIHATNTFVFSDSINVVQTIFEQFPRVTVQDDITVTQTVAGGPSIRKITVHHNVYVSSIVNWSGIATAASGDDIDVIQSINQSSENTSIIFTQIVNVLETINHHRFDIRYVDQVDVSHHVRIWNMTVPITVNDTISVGSYSKRYVDPVRITVREEATVQQAFRLAGIRVDINMTVQHAVLVFDDIIKAGPNRQVVRDAVHVTPEIDPFIHKLTFILTDNIGVTDTTRCNFNSQTIAQAISIGDRQFQTPTVKHKITVDQKIHRINEQKVSQAITLQETISESRIFKPRHLLDINPLTDLVIRPATFTRYLIDVMDLGPDYREIRDPLIGIVTVPSLIGIIMSDKTPSVYLRSRYGQVILPPPEFGDTRGTTISTAIARTITGRAASTVKNSRRELFKWAFVIGQLKALELRRWLVKNLSEVITITDWEGNMWIGRITSNPVSLDFQARWEGEVEKVVVDLEFQVLPLT